jgi:hypothetical protein
MNQMTNHRHGRAGSTRHWQETRSGGAPLYYGWSHENRRMEMMDLPGYLDSFRQGYEQALSDLQSQLATLAGAMAPGGVGLPQMPPGPTNPTFGPGHEHHHHHGCDCADCRHERHHGRWHHHGDDCDCDCGCGCGHRHDCACECCIGDADIVVYGRCGEVHVVPIEITNDTRRAREDVTLEVSEPRSAGGRQLGWQVLLQPEAAVTLPPCSTTKVELLVHIQCGDKDTGQKGTGQKDTAPAKSGAKKAAATTESGAGNLVELVARQRIETGDVDRCEVGYVTVRAEGCLLRPIVVAIAVLPDECGSFRSWCACGCC